MNPYLVIIAHDEQDETVTVGGLLIVGKNAADARSNAIENLRGRGYGDVRVIATTEAVGTPITLTGGDQYRIIVTVEPLEGRAV